MHLICYLYEDYHEARSLEYKVAQLCINSYPQSPHKYPHTVPSNKTRPVLCTTLQTKHSYRNLCRNRQLMASDIHEVLNNVQAKECTSVIW